jgi:6-phosphogluconolactonase
MHTASLFPGADRLAEALAPDAPVLLPMRAEGAPEARMTLTAPVLRGALHLHLLLLGSAKREALELARTLPAELAPVRAVLDNAVIHWAE